MDNLPLDIENLINSFNSFKDIYKNVLIDVKKIKTTKIKYKDREFGTIIVNGKLTNYCWTYNDGLYDRNNTLEVSDVFSNLKHMLQGVKHQK